MGVVNITSARGCVSRFNERDGRLYDATSALGAIANHYSKLGISRLIERAAILRLYDLRHSCATLLLAANENPKVVSERLGHASITFTMAT